MAYISIERVRKHLDKHNLTATEAAKRAGLGQNALVDIFAGRVKNPTLQTAVAFAKLFNCTVNDLMELGETRAEDVDKHVELLPVDKFEGLEFEEKIYIDSSDIVLSIIREKKITLTLSQTIKCIKEIYICIKQNMNQTDFNIQSVHFLANYLMEKIRKGEKI
jgi:DNA-binding XRE family transcriptional regulator